ncbi:MAG: (E)-4-hydroxy-3-methylbut-2-enyl-diphosphate synthase [Bacteroidaceae bacterium]|nr:(E)-4-hydroxy-3-methylbut-2-enyl-diphosphate synthase [Bacteroidaceae bacterium]
MSIRQIDTDLFNCKRRKTVVVNVGGVNIGYGNPIRVQSMTNTGTMDTDGSVEQVLRIVNKGGELVRLTTQGNREAVNLGSIKERLVAMGCNVPLVADVHFNAAVADTAAKYADKVRVNPGNYVDSARTFKHIDYTDAEYADELKRLRERFVSFLNLCKVEGKAIRVGVNHGSLSDRIMSRYGDTPSGVVESCMEFLRICRDENFNNVVVSIKTSNTSMMVTTVRRLVNVMASEGISYPLHLGVTEAGDAEDGRIKSAVGIGALLADGIGDTLRVSLAEAPENEIPVAKELAEYIALRENHEPIDAVLSPDFDYEEPQRRKSNAVGIVGGENVPVVIGGDVDDADVTSDFLASEVRVADISSAVDGSFVALDYASLTAENIAKIKSLNNIIVVASSAHVNPVGELRALVHKLTIEGVNAPVIVRRLYNEKSVESLRIKAAADLGVLLIDGLVDGLWVEDSIASATELNAIMFGILQATRARISKTEYIACPGCGRTMYDLQGTLARIKTATSHLKGLKIGVMGCIVNGPGEMADADYGYVGAARGKVSLYRRKECVEKNIPEEEAIERLLQLIDNDRNQN